MASAARLVLAALIAVAPFAVRAAETPQPGPVDPRIRTVDFDPDQVVTLHGYLGYQLTLEFAADERIENVAIGDSLAWQVTPNKRATLLFLKPVDRRAETNMVVVTSRRRYTFDLISTGAGPRAGIYGQAPYVVRFRYPHEAPAVVVSLPPPPPPEPPKPEDAYNFAYSYVGARSNLPTRVFDDGHDTFFEWAPQTPAPAVFVVGPDGKESLVDTFSKGKYVVAGQVASQFVLRNGRQTTLVNNDAAPPPPGSALQPTRKGARR